MATTLWAILLGAANPFAVFLVGLSVAFGLLLGADPIVMTIVCGGFLAVPLIVGGLVGRALDLAQGTAGAPYLTLVSLFVAGWCFELVLQGQLWGRLIALAAVPSLSAVAAFGAGIVLLGASAASVVCMLVVLVEAPLAWWFSARRAQLTNLVVRPALPWIMWCFGSTYLADLLMHEIGAW